MNKKISIREAIAERDVAEFWNRLHEYHKRDIFPEPGNEDLEYFLDDSQYRADIERLHNREKDRCSYLFFSEDGRDLGFALAVIYGSEEGKCFIMEFCVYPEYRGVGRGTACAEAFMAWAKDRGAEYFELNCDDRRRCRFWSRLGFRPNGVDEWGMALMLLPPEKMPAVTVEKISEPDWQFIHLENSFLAEIGEETLSDEKRERLEKAVREGRISFFQAKAGSRALGICSVSHCFSSFACCDVAYFDDFYIEPAFRKKGIARLLCVEAQRWCGEQGIASLSVCCAPCDEEMYRMLGFDIPLGRSFACITG